MTKTDSKPGNANFGSRGCGQESQRNPDRTTCAGSRRPGLLPASVAPLACGPPGYPQPRVRRGGAAHRRSRASAHESLASASSVPRPSGRAATVTAGTTRNTRWWRLPAPRDAKRATCEFSGCTPESLSGSSSSLFHPDGTLSLEVALLRACDNAPTQTRHRLMERSRCSIDICMMVCDELQLSHSAPLSESKWRNMLSPSRAEDGLSFTR